MTTSRPKIYITRTIPAPVENRMGELFNIEINRHDRPLREDELIAAVQTADILVPTLTDKISAEIISKAGKQLVMIANFGNGTDHIDIKAAYSRGITVTNTPDVLTNDTADMTMALILAVPRRILPGALKIVNNQWDGWSPTWMLGKRVNHKDLGIIGMGRIGTAVARRARAFGMNIHYHNRTEIARPLADELQATFWPSLSRMLARMDIISVHCPYTPATYHLLSAPRLNLIKPGAYLINTSRGEIIDEDALADLLVSGKIAGAGLDVFEHEPTINPKLLELDNVLLLPHMGSATIESRIDMGEKVIINIKSFIDHHKPPNRVLPLTV